MVQCQRCGEFLLMPISNAESGLSLYQCLGCGYIFTFPIRGTSEDEQPTTMFL